MGFHKNQAIMLEEFARELDKNMTNIGRENQHFLESQTDSGRTWEEYIKSVKGLDEYTRKKIKCTKCGGEELTYNIIKFYDFDGHKFMCYHCQGLK